MARRTVWLVTGVVAGGASTLYAERKLRRTLEAVQARMQPDALVVEVGRTARQAASTTGGRVRDAVATARLEKQRREVELWTELGVPSDDADADGRPVPTPIDDVIAAATGGPVHPLARRARRAARRYPSHLGH